MHIQKHIPSVLTRKWVDHLIFLENRSSTNQRIKVLPEGKIFLSYVYAGKMTKHGRQEIVKGNRETYLAGHVMEDEYELSYNPGCKQLVIELKPGALYYFFHIQNISQFDNLVIPLKPFDRGALNHRLMTCTTEEEMMHAIESYFLIKSKTAIPENIYFETALQLIQESKGTHQVSEIARKCDISVRQLNNIFYQCHGLSPKQYAKIVQLNAVIQALQQKEQCTLTQISLQFGFYDQSHFIRTFKKYVLSSPKSFIKGEIDLLASSLVM